MLALAMVFGVEVTMAAVVTGTARGITDRSRSNADGALGGGGRALHCRPGRLGAPAGAGGGWATGHATLLAVVWPVALTVVFAVLGVRRFQALSR